MRTLVLTALLTLAAASPATAAEFQVDSTAPGNGNCALPGQCTLRQAIADAKTVPGRDTIRVPPGTYDQTGQDLIVSIGEQVEIVGADPRTTVIREVSGGDGRVFLVEQDATLDLSGVTLTGSRNASAVLLFGSGMTFRATNVVFTGNTATNGAAIDATGGAVELARSTLTGNVATGKGGAIYLGGAGSRVTAVNTTISGNTAPDGAGIAADQGLATVRGTTVANNTGAPDVRGAIAAHASIVGSCAGAIGSLGANASADPACALERTAPLQLGVLGDHGGATSTMVPAAGSPAVDADPSCAAGTSDQRGLARPQGAACDAGAVEVPAPGMAPPPSTTPVPFALTALRVTPNPWRIARGAALITVRANIAGTVRFTVQRARGGRLVGGRCAAPTRASRRRAVCTRFVAVRGSFTRAVRPGTTTIRFAGRLGGRQLGVGRYRLIARASTGEATRRAGFTVVRAARRR